MSKSLYRVLFVTSMMIFTSLAGCIESSESDDETVVIEPGVEYYGKIMTSTYHVEQLVSAVVGDTATVELMSTTNIPVHDYNPSVIDIERLKGSDAFFYHGLELEPWVDGILASEGVPPSYMTHTMPTGEITLDYQTMLVNDLCEQLTSGDKVSNNLLSYEDQAGQLEIHLEKGVQTLTFPPADTSHDGHDHDDHDDDDHGDHDDDDHGDHDDGDHDDDDHPPTPEELLNMTDTDNSNTMTLDEFIAFMNSGEDEDSLPQTIIDEFSSIFTTHDADESGDLDSAELPNFIAGIDAYMESTEDGDHDDDHGHDGHGDHDGHEDHDAHDDHAHAEAEKVIENPVNCPTDTVISVFHLEEGEHVVEFETNWWARTSFDMAALPMMGGHAHHHHGHGDGPFEWAGIFAMNDASHTWSMQKVGGAYADPTMRLVLIPTATPDEATMHSLEGGVEALIEGDCTVVEDGETMSNIAETGTCFELHVGTGDDSTFNMDTTGLSGLAIYAQHVPTEFERDQHYLKDSTGADIEPVAQEGGGDHGHHGHGDHDDHDDEAVCHDPETHQDTEHTDRESCEAAGNIWMAGEPNDGTRGYMTIHVENEGDYGFAVPSDISVFILMGEGHEGHDHGGHDGHDDHGEGGHDDDAHDEDGHDEDGHSDDDSTGSGDSTIVADEDEEFEYDPHSWLDPISFKAQTQLVLNALIEVFPNGTDTFTANAEAFMAELDKVHLGYVGAFGPEGTCTNNTVAANHNAYSYITERYGVEFVTVHGLDPEGQPSVEDIEKVINKINEDEIGVLFIEEYTQASSVDLIVDETNVEVMYLYTMEKAPSDASDDYLSMLNKNLDNLKTGLGCAV